MLSSFLYILSITLQMFIHPGLILNHRFFTGLMFRFVLTSLSRQQRSPRLRTAAIGGVYDSLLSRMRTITGATTVGAGPPNVTPSSIVGVAIAEEILTNRAVIAFLDGQVGNHYHTLLVLYLTHTSSSRPPDVKPLCAG